jgi:uncharacterized protein DUF5309
LSNLYINLDKRLTPFQGRLKRGEDLQNVKLFSWPLETYDGRMISGVPENKDVDDFETDKQYQLYGRSQKFWRRPHVSTEANTINKAPADFGKYNKQVVKKTQEQKRDIEQRLLSDVDSRDDDGVNGREFQGLGRFINDTTSVGSAGAALTFTDTQTSVPTQFRTPTAQIYVGQLVTGGVITFDTDAINVMLQNRFDALGSTPRMSGFVDPLLKRHFTRIERYVKTMAGYTATAQRYNTDFSASNFIDYGADLYESDFGPIDINMDSWMPRTSAGALSGRGYFLDMEFMTLRASGLFLTHQSQEDKGAGPRGLIQSILGPQWGDPRTHCKVDPNIAIT